MVWLPIVLRPFVFLASLAALLFICYLIIWYMPEGTLKRILLIDV